MRWAAAGELWCRAISGRSWLMTVCAVVRGELLQRDTLGQRHLLGQSAGCGQVSGFAVGGLPGGVVSSPQRGDGERGQYCAEHSDGRGNESGDVVVLVPAVMRSPGLGQVQAGRDSGGDAGENARAGTGNNMACVPLPWVRAATG